MLRFSLQPTWMIGSMQVDAEVDDDFASIPRRRAPNCSSTTSGGVDFEEKGIVDDVDDPDMIEKARTCSKETEFDRISRTNCGGEAGEPIPADPRQNIVERVRYEYFQQIICNGYNAGSIRQINPSY